MIPGIGHSPASSSSNLENQVSSGSQEERGYFSLPFQVYQDSPVVPRHQIPVLPTPSSPEERFFPGQDPPSYESVMASGGGGAGGGAGTP